jgi:hypothetical protein
VSGGRGSGEDGNRHELLIVLNEVLEHLGYDCPEVQAVAWVLEREDAVARLREVCAVYGDNNWPATARIGDVIEKHLRHHLDEPRMPT